MAPVIDVVVVGSGPAGVQAAQTLVEAGCVVSLVDVGFDEPANAQPVPSRPFDEIRRTDEAQHRYFLGSQFEGVPFGGVGAGPQVMPTRGYVLRRAEACSGIAAGDFAVLESHALGGLGAAWGAVSFPYLDVELEQSGLRPADLRLHYERVAARIGVSGAYDDLLAVRGPLEALQPALASDHNAAAILARYEKSRSWFAARRLYLGQTLLAALSQPLGDREPNPGYDLEFWSNPGDSVYRPDLTVRRLERCPNFTYESGWFVDGFSEQPGGGVELRARSHDGAAQRRWLARRLVLAAGAPGTTRIVLQSLQAFDRRVPFVCNAHVYVPCVHLRQLGRPHAAACHSLAQLTMIHDPTGTGEHLVQAQMYSYRSLLLFRLLKEAPLPHREALRIMRDLAPAFAIWVVEHEDQPSPDSWCLLESTPSGPVLRVTAKPDQATEQRQLEHEAALVRGMRKLGCWPIRRVHPGHGSSLHYGGQFPPCEGDDPLTTDADGRLRGTRSVFIADGSALRYLPAKGLTLTLMANADRVASRVFAGLREGGTVGGGRS